jgi:hypothetical protein
LTNLHRVDRGSGLPRPWHGRRRHRV